MTRPLRIEYPDAWYHVMNRGRRGEPVFTNKADFDTFITLLRESTELWGIRVAAYCLMSNHYHLLVQTPRANLSRAMRHIDGIYTQRFNRRRKTTGQVFAGRYRSIIVDADSYLLDVVRYIHKNPVRAGMVGKIEQYPWTSHPGYRSDSPRWDWLYKEFVLSTFSTDRGIAKKRYQRFMADDDTEEITRFFAGHNVRAILGSDRFVGWIRERFSDGRSEKEVLGSKFFLPTIEEVMDAVCSVYGTQREALLTPKRGVLNEARSLAIYLSRRLTGETLKEIGNRFGRVGYSAVGNTIARVKREERNDRELKGKIALVMAKTRSGQMKI
jgi:putative transposase